MTADLSLDLGALQARYAAGLSPRDVMAEVYRRIRVAEDPYIFISLRDEAEVMAEVAALPARDAAAMPLWGVPFAVKDNIDVGGMPTTAACPAFAYDAPADAFVVARLRAAGAIVIGKTNLDQFATGLVGSGRRMACRAMPSTPRSYRAGRRRGPPLRWRGGS